MPDWQDFNEHSLPFPSRQDFLGLFENLYNGKTKEGLDPAAEYDTVEDVERLPKEELEATSTTGTALQSAVDALNARGYKTDPTIGSFMRATSLTVQELHDIVCFCHYGKKASGMLLSARFMVVRINSSNAESRNAETRNRFRGLVEA